MSPLDSERRNGVHVSCILSNALYFVQDTGRPVVLRLVCGCPRVVTFSLFNTSNETWHCSVVRFPVRHLSVAHVPDSRRQHIGLHA